MSREGGPPLPSRYEIWQASFILKFIIQQMLLLMLFDKVAAEIQVLIPGHGKLHANIRIAIFFNTAFKYYTLHHFRISLNFPGNFYTKQSCYII